MRLERLVFTHIPKTGGNSVNGLLHSAMVKCGASTLSFEGAATCYREVIAPIRLLERHHLSLDEFSVIAGHIPFSVARQCFNPARFVTILREPAWLQLSSYCSQPAHQALPNMGLDELEAKLEANPNAEWALDNMQTRMLSDGPAFGGPVTLEMLESAKRNLRECYALVGRQDDLARFFRGLGDLYGLEIDPASVQRLNVTSGYRDLVTDRHLVCASRHNAFDVELYKWASAHCAVRPSIDPISAPIEGRSSRKVVLGGDDMRVVYSQ